jgi:hypothetical protein
MRNPSSRGFGVVERNGVTRPSLAHRVVADDASMMPRIHANGIMK